VRTIGRCGKEQTEYTVSIVVISKVLFDYRQIFVNNAIML